LALEIKGIGPVLAERIVAYRESQGPFETLEGLLAVAGMGPTLLERLRGELMCGEGEPLQSPEVEMIGSGAAAIEWPSFQGQAGGLEGDGSEPISTPESRASQPEPAAEQSVPAERSSEGSAGTAEPTPPTAVPHALRPGADRADSRQAGRSAALLVLLGGLLGAMLTLLVLAIVSGTVDFASRREVEALSRNMATMQASAELSWARIDALTRENATLEQRLARMESLADRVADLEGQLAAVQADIRATDARLAAVEGRMEAAEVALAKADERMEELAEQAAAMQAQVVRFDGFFSALRDLLIEMQGAPGDDVGGTAEPRTPVPTPEPPGRPAPTPALYRS
jgi:competence ComEA-like helix-hairpin-helix protein